MRAWARALLAALLPAACAGSGARADLVIDHATVLDGSGGAALADARVVVRGGRIASLGPARGPAPPAAQVIDARGRFLLPGFIDMHAHLLFPRCTPGAGPPRFDRALSERALARQLAWGVTTVRSPATPTVAGLRLRDDLNAGRVAGPRAVASAELIGDGALDARALRQVVRGSLPLRPDAIKVYAGLSPAQVGAVIAEAHRHGLPVIGHLQATSWNEGLESGIDHLVHAADWSGKSLPPAARPAYARALSRRGAMRARIDWLELFDPDGPEARALAAHLARRQVSVDVTLMAYAGKFPVPGDDRSRAMAELADFPELREDWQRCPGPAASWTADDHRRWQAAWPKLLRWVRRMDAAGVLLVSGTDLTNEGIAPGEGLHHEFALLASAGLAAPRILRMTGLDAARALGRGDIGLVAPGRRADLVLLAADPRADIGHTRSVVGVVQGGRLVSGGPDDLPRHSMALLPAAQ